MNYFNKILKILKNNTEKIYGEQNSEEWWSTVKFFLPLGSKLLSIILYFDATNCNTLEKSLLCKTIIGIFANNKILQYNRKKISGF